jgi:signal transduction histidine kinase
MGWLWWLLLGIALGAIGMLPVLRSVLRRVERRAREATHRAEESERLAELGSMTSGLAHEIKNPLSTISLNAQLLMEALGEAGMPAEESARLQRRSETLRREVDRLGGILTDFLQFAGRVRLDPQPRDLVKLVDELSDFFHPQCDQAGIVMRLQLPAAPVPVRIDESLTKQAVLNLMINATQAMQGAADRREPSELILRVETGEGEARIHVIDTGPGIDPEQVRAIFRPYVSTRSGGTGLGLPTTRRIIQEHGGRLEVVSEPGRGSDFVVHLPLAAQAPQPESPA